MFNPVCCVFDGHAQDEESGSATCRFCLGTDTAENMIAPCLCAGSSKFVHRTCLNEWRAQEVRPRAFTHCLSCRFQYLTECPSESPRDARIALWRFRLFVARDMGVLFGAVQLLIAATASFVHMIDSAGRIPAMFPKDWASRHASVISVGPYYCTGAVVFFAVIGLMALILESFGVTQYLGCSRPEGSVTNLGSECEMGAVGDRGCRPQNALAVRMAPTAHAVSMVPTVQTVACAPPQMPRACFAPCSCFWSSSWPFWVFSLPSSSAP